MNTEKERLLETARSMSECRELFVCPVTLDTFDSPVELQCGHSISENAAKQIQSANPKLPCPVCRKNAHPGVAPFVPNFALRDTMEKLGISWSSKYICILQEQRKYLHAIETKNTSVAVAALRKIVSIEKRNAMRGINSALDLTGSNPLHVAASIGMTEVVDFLLAADAKVNMRNNNGVTPLYMAAEEGHIEIVDALIKKGADVNVRTYSYINIDDDTPPLNMEQIGIAYSPYYTPLLIATYNGHKDVIETLIKGGADLHMHTDIYETPLHIAAQEGNKDVIKILIKWGANVNMHTDIYKTPLHMAAQNGHKDVIETFIKGGADVNLHTDTYGTPLHMAAQNGHKDVIEALIKGGADVNLHTKQNWTPLHMAAKNGHTDVIEALIKRGADINLRTEIDNDTPLDIAAKHGHKDVIETLIKRGAYVIDALLHCYQRKASEIVDASRKMDNVSSKITWVTHPEYEYYSYTTDVQLANGYPVKLNNTGKIVMVATRDDDTVPLTVKDAKVARSYGLDVDYSNISSK
jgi:ankyrin repeat protein